MASSKPEEKAVVVTTDNQTAEAVKQLTEAVLLLAECVIGTSEKASWQTEVYDRRIEKMRKKLK